MIKLTKREFRTTRDGRTRINPVTDAIRPLVNGVKDIELRIDRLAEAAERRRADAADRQLRDLFDGVVERIYAKDAAKERQAKSEAFERRLFGRRLPRNLHEKLFGVPDEPEPETLSTRQRLFGKQNA